MYIYVYIYICVYIYIYTLCWDNNIGDVSDFQTSGAPETTLSSVLLVSGDS